MQALTTLKGGEVDPDLGVCVEEAGERGGEAGEAEIEGQPLPKRKPLPALTDAQRNGVVFNEEALPLYTTADGHAFVDCPAGDADCTTVGEWHAAIAADLEPILLKYGVDMWNSGHVHDYESTWPIKNGNVTQTNYVEPKGIVHVTDGNGGVPGVVGGGRRLHRGARAGFRVARRAGEVRRGG